MLTSLHAIADPNALASRAGEAEVPPATRWEGLYRWVDRLERRDRGLPALQSVGPFKALP